MKAISDVSKGSERVLRESQTRETGAETSSEVALSLPHRNKARKHRDASQMEGETSLERMLWH